MAAEYSPDLETADIPFDAAIDWVREANQAVACGDMAKAVLMLTEALSSATREATIRIDELSHQVEVLESELSTFRKPARLPPPVVVTGLRQYG